MRVLQFTDGFSKSSETFIYDQVLELQRQGVDVHVLAYSRHNIESRPFTHVHSGIWPTRLAPARWATRAMALVGLIERNTHAHIVVRARIRRLLKRLKPDVIHAHFGNRALMIAPVAKSLGIPLVVTFHGYDVNSWLSRPGVRDQYRILLSDAKLAIAVSDNLMAKVQMLLPKTGGAKLVRLYNGTLINDFAPVERGDRALASIGLLFVGRMVPVKGPIYLLQSFLAARELLREANGPDITLTMAGSGALKTDAERFIEDNKLHNCVSTLGEVDHSRVRKLMCEADIYVQHNVIDDLGNQEGLGVSLIESQASGLPAVGTYSGGVAEVIADKRTGILVEPGSIDQMAQAIVSLCLDKSQRTMMGAAARKHAVENFDLTRQVSSLIKLYSSIKSFDAL